MRQLSLILFVIFAFAAIGLAQSPADSNGKSSYSAGSSVSGQPGPILIADFADRGKQIDPRHLWQSPIPQRVKHVFINPGHQKLDWTKTHPRFNKTMHWIALSIGTTGTIVDGVTSHRVIKDIVQDKTTGAVTVICESNGAFKAPDGCGFLEKKFFLVEGGGIVGGAEAIRPFFAAASDIIEISIGGVGFYNARVGLNLVRRGTVIGHK